MNNEVYPNCSLSELRQKIEKLDTGYETANGICYSQRDDLSFRIYLNGERGNAFSPVYKCEVKESDDTGTVLTGKFVFRTFTVNFLCLWMLFIISLFYISLRRMVINYQSNGSLNNDLSFFLLALVFTGILCFTVFAGRKRFSRDRDLIMDFLRNYTA